MGMMKKQTQDIKSRQELIFLIMMAIINKQADKQLGVTEESCATLKVVTSGAFIRGAPFSLFRFA